MAKPVAICCTHAILCARVARPLNATTPAAFLQIATGHRQPPALQCCEYMPASCLMCAPKSTVGNRRTLRSAKLIKAGGPAARLIAAVPGRRGLMLTLSTGLSSSIATAYKDSRPV